MKAVIQKLELKKVWDRHYIKIELIDENGVKRNINNPLLSDEINFRKQVFGIMSSCNCYDLMRLTTNNPNCRKMIGYYQNGLQILENKKKEWLKFDKDNGIYICKKPSRKLHKMFDILIEQKMFKGYKEEGIIETIASQSGTFQLLFTCQTTSTWLITGQIYYGFGYPINIGTNINPSDEKESAKMFTSFIISLMKLYGINDLLKFGGKIDNLPVVEIELNNDNEITSITNPTTGMGLAIGTGYEIVNISKLKEYKRK